jgi:uncharacterized protein YjbI with pentapeptide repeats
MYAKGANFKGTHLENSTMSFADFRETKSWKANFSDAILVNTDFSDAELGDAKFIRNDLRTIKFKNSLLWQTHFKDTIMNKKQCAYAQKEEAFLENNVTCR